ncbi:type VII secretion integral membrane protein EccD [Streptacidiphilus sp. PB12-B1b]|uniref:type VII secretion integral membrane protein EccD n=1 Tax=Streptacidiphilus sp. PB12-B1b TaxID=2705012 RepID=UPI0015FA2B00|nr:type VII secretion integral membrane protein EccD [Streptacidiphilus sp. PB12-B1b]QMU77934.1 type VII secretion integral membrane protein EccD [Streptacidiphilus sp. PB12-B1b]
MTEKMPNDLCRLILVAADRTLDVAVPADVPICYLLPTLLRHAGAGLPDEGAVHDGWVLQRLGEDPLEEDATAAEAGLRDGDRLYLRPRQERLPAVDFDDLVAGIADGIRDRPDRWTPQLTRWMFLGLLGAALLAGLGLLLLPGARPPRCTAAAATALFLLVSAALSDRLARDRAGAAVLGCAALPCAALSGLLLRAPGHGHGAGGRELLAGCAAVLVAAVLAGLGVGGSRRLFAAAGLAAAFTGVGALVTGVAGGSAAGGAACTAVLALALNPLVPTVSFRLAGMRVPPLPVGVEELLRNTEPLKADELRAGARATDLWMTALTVGIGGACAGALTVLARADGWGPGLAVGGFCAVLLLRCRLLPSAWQRLALLAPAGCGLVVLAVHLGQRAASAPERLGVGLAAVAVVALALLAASRTLADRRLLPYWGRAAEIAETAVGVALVPLAVLLLGVFGWARGLGG